MKKQLIARGLLGFPIGIAIGYVITIIVSAVIGGGHYASVTPQLAARMGSELNAVALQALLCGAMGSGLAAASLIWDVEGWSIAKQTGLYFAVSSLLILLPAYFANWMQRTLAGFLSYFGIFALIFLIVWIAQYFSLKVRIKALNAGIKK